MNFLTNTIGLRSELLRFRDHGADELSFYSAATTDIEFKFPFGWGELWGIADRTDYDLNAHMKESKQYLSYFDPFTNTKYVPYVIELSLGLNRLFLVTLLNAYTQVETEEGSRIIMKFKASIAPIKVAILPLVKKLGAEAMEIYKLLSPHFTCEYDEAGAIGKRYYRMDEIGVPFSICVDSDNYN
jgi:glycyl-tRNA synthetase